MMSSPQIIYTLRWLIHDTFRQALATRIFWIMLGFSALCIVFCLGVSVEGGDVVRDGDFYYHPRTDEPLAGPANDLGYLRLMFGAMRVSLARDRESGIHLLHVILASWVAGAVGLLATLVWTAGFVPDFLQPSNAAVLFAKPAPRWLLLAGKYVGVVCLVGFQAAIYFCGTWLALGIKTGVWLPNYLAGIPLLVFHFAAIYSVSLWLGTITRSAIAAALGSVLFWALCFGLNYGRDAAVSLPTLAPQAPPLSSFTLTVIDLAYWMLPKPADYIMVLEQALDAKAHMATLSSMPEFATAQSMGQIDLGGAIFTTFLFSVVVVAAAGRRLEKTDY